MSKRKFKQGAQIHCVSDFDQSCSKYYIVHFGEKHKTIHRSFLMSWQYRTLLNFIIRGEVYEADVIKEEGHEQKHAYPERMAAIGNKR